MEENRNPPILPSNYVTLSELQERWKKMQQWKLKVKEVKEEQQRQREKQQNQQLERRIPQVNLKKRTEKPGRNENRKISRRNEAFKETVSGVSPNENCVVPVAVVEANERERNAGETNIKELRDNEVNQKRWNKKNKKSKWKKKKKEKIVKDEEARTEGEGEIVVSEKLAPPVKSEKENIPAKRYGRRRETGLFFRPKSASIVEKDNSKVDMEGETKNVVEESEENVEIEQKLGDMCIGKENDGSETQNSTVNHSNSEYRGYNRLVNGGNSEYRGRYGNVYRGNTNYRGYDGGFNRPNLHYRGDYYGRGTRSRKRNGMVWVKKECVADATEGPEINGGGDATEGPEINGGGDATEGPEINGGGVQQRN